QEPGALRPACARPGGRRGGQADRAGRDRAGPRPGPDRDGRPGGQRVLRRVLTAEPVPWATGVPDPDQQDAEDFAMTLADTPLNDVSVWVRGSLIPAVLLVIGTILLTRFASWAGNRYLARIDAQASESDELVRS